MGLGYLRASGRSQEAPIHSANRMAPGEHERAELLVQRVRAQLGKESVENAALQRHGRAGSSRSCCSACLSWRAVRGQLSASPLHHASVEHQPTDSHTSNAQSQESDLPSLDSPHSGVDAQQ
jgi:hypothetical protein